MPDNDNYGEKGVYRTKSSEEWIRRVRSAASTGLPLEVLADGLQKMVSEGTINSSDASKYEMFFRLVGLGKVALGKSPQSSEDLYEIIFSVARELPDTRPETVHKETIVSLDQMAQDVRSEGIRAAMSDYHIDINALPEMTLEEFKKYVRGKNIRAISPPYNPLEITRITGLPQRSVESYIASRGFSQTGNVALTWGDVVAIAQISGMCENKVIMNMAEYVGAKITDKEKYTEKGLRKVHWNQLREEMQSAKLDFYDALSVSMGWISKRDLLREMPAQSWKDRMPPHTPHFTLYNIRKMIEDKHHLPDYRMREVREGMVKRYCSIKGITHHGRDDETAITPTHFEQTFKTERERGIARAISESIPNAWARKLRDAEYAEKRGQEKFNSPEARRARAEKTKETKRQNKRAREIGEHVAKEQRKRDNEQLTQLDLFFGGDGNAFKKQTQ